MVAFSKRMKGFMKIGASYKASFLDLFELKNRDVAAEISRLILNKAYDQYPLKANISSTGLVLSLADKYNDRAWSRSENVGDLDSNKSPVRIANATIKQLEESGLISLESRGGGYDVFLTQKGIDAVKEKRILRRLFKLIPLSVSFFRSI